MGLLGSFLFLLGGAFAFKLPTVSAVIFGLAALILISGASTASYSDLSIWAGVAAILCLLAIGGRVEARRKARRLAGQYVPQQYAPQQYVPQHYVPQQYAPQQYAPQQYGPQQYAPQQYAPQQPQQYAPQQPQQYAPTPQSHVQLGE